MDSSLRTRPPIAVTAVVLTWRDVATTLGCVDALLESDRVSRVLVVDNESTGSLDMHAAARGRRVVLLRERRNLGFSAGVNSGLRAAMHHPDDFLLVINNDARLGKEDLERLCDELASDKRLGAVAPRIIDGEGRDEKSWGCLTPTMRLDRAVEPQRADYFTWACILMRSSLLDEVGYLDESFFMYWEDVEFGLRLRRRGISCGYLPEASAIHARSSSHAAAGPAIQKYSTHGLVVLACKENRMAAGVSRALLRFIRCLLLGKARHALACLSGLWLAVVRPNVRGCDLFP